MFPSWAFVYHLICFGLKRQVQRGHDTELTVLYLFDKDLALLPNSIGNLSKEDTCHVPDFVGELTELTHLDLSHNRLYELPDFLGNLKKLKILNLHATWIKELPEWVGKLKNLVELDISNNDIIVDPKITKKLPKLKKYYSDF